MRGRLGHVTLLVLPESPAGEIRRLRVSRVSLLGLAVAGVTVSALVALSIVASGSSLRSTRENERLRGENARLSQHVLTMDQHLDEIDAVVERLDDLDGKLRAVALTTSPVRSLAMGPVGAPAIDSRTLPDPVRAKLRRDLLNPADSTRALRLLQDRVDRAQREAHATNQSARRLSAFIEGQQALLAATPSRAPARGYVTSEFGMRLDPFTGAAQHHQGIDFSASIGTDVVATADGVVTYAGMQGSYGELVQIDHGGGLASRYGHLMRPRVEVGQFVHRGEIVGRIGNSGRSTGPHVHYEVRLNGIPQDPRRFILD